MKTILLFCLITCCSFNQTEEKNSRLPFSINYQVPLKITRQQHFEKYDYTEYSGAEDILQLKRYAGITRQVASKMIEDRKFFIDALFKDQPSPYPGVLSSTIGCPIELVPKPYQDTVDLKLCYKLMATQNLIYGNCNVKDNFYYCVYMLLYCQDKNDFFEVKLYTPITNPSFEYNDLLRSLKCKN